MSKLSAHVQNLNDATVDHLRRAVYPAIKCMTNVSPQALRDRVLPAYDEAEVPRPFIWVRDWTDDKRDEWIRMGKAGARAFFDRTAPKYDVWSELTDVVEGQNEAIVWTVDEMRRVDEFEAELVLLWHTHGKRYVGGNWSVGHPDLALWPEYRDALQHMDFLGLHMYGWPEGVAGDGVPFLWHPWRVFRYQMVRQTILSNNVRLPPILLTEIGWARAVWNRDLGDVGFKTAPAPNAYHGWLVSLDAKMCADSDVRYGAIFQTGANRDWQTFDIVGHFVGNCIADYTRVNALHPVVPEPEPTDPSIADVNWAKRALGPWPATMKDARIYHEEWIMQDPNREDRYISRISTTDTYYVVVLDPQTWQRIRATPIGQTADLL